MSEIRVLFEDGWWNIERFDENNHLSIISLTESEIRKLGRILDQEGF